MEFRGFRTHVYTKSDEFYPQGFAYNCKAIDNKGFKTF